MMISPQLTNLFRLQKSLLMFLLQPGIILTYQNFSSPHAPDQCSAEVLRPLGTSDHFLVFVKLDAKPKTSSDVPFHRTLYQYNKADCNRFRSYITEEHPSALYKSKLPGWSHSFLSGFSTYYISVIRNNAGRMVGSFNHTRKYQLPAAMFYLHKSQIKPRKVYCCYIWAGAAQSSIASLDKVQKHLHGFVGDELFYTLQPLSHR